MKGEVLNLRSFLNVISSPKGYYIVGYSWVFGMSVWVTFFGGVIAYKALPRQQFGNLQHKTFPVYFMLSIGISSSLLALWISSHPEILSQWNQPNVCNVAQAYTLGVAVLTQAINYFVIGPLTSKTMLLRHKLEKAEGKTYNEPGVSDKMKALNRRFGMLHGISSLANLGAVIALGFHGLWIGTAGI